MDAPPPSEPSSADAAKAVATGAASGALAGPPGIAVGAVTAAAGVAAEKAKVEKAKFDEDPVAYIGHKALRFGLIFIAGGVIAYVAAQATARQEQAFLNDINNRLDLSPSQPPTPSPGSTAPPTPPYFQSDYESILTAQVNLSPTNAVANATQVNNGWLAAQDLLNQMVNVAAPSQAIVDCQNVVGGFEALVNDFGYVSPAEYAEAQAATASLGTQIADLQGVLKNLPPGSQEYQVTAALLTGLQTALTEAQSIVSKYDSWQAGSPQVNWTSAGTDSANLLVSVNSLAVDLGLPQPYQLTAASTTSSGSTSSGGGGWNWGNAWNATWQVVINNGAALLQGGVGGVVVNIATGGLTPSGGAVNQSDGQVVQAAKAVASTATSLIGDVEKAAQEFALGLVNFPMILWDGLGYSVTWAINTICTDIWWPLLGFGIVLTAVGLFCLKVWPLLKPRLAVRGRAFWAGLVQKYVDPVLHTGANIKVASREQRIEGTIERALEDPIVAPVIIGAKEAGMAEAQLRVQEKYADLHEKEPEPTPEPTPEAPPAPPEPSEVPATSTTTTIPGTLPESTLASTAVPPLPTPTPEVEEKLGEGDVLEPTPAEVEAMERARRESLPTEVVQPAYADAAPKPEPRRVTLDEEMDALAALSGTGT